MKKIFQMVLTIFCLFVFGRIYTYADELLSPSSESSSNFSTEIQNTEEEIESLALAGNGTESNPYQVSNVSDLQTALAKPITSGNALYIQLVSDIVYRGNDKNKNINKNTVLDGAGHYILYNDTSYDQSLFETSADNLNITFKNIKYGNTTYPNNSYWGMLFTINSRINFVVENIDWNIKNGSQPFWGDSNPFNTLTFKGINNFKSAGDKKGGEFVEGFSTINFSDDSKTTVYNDSTDSDAVFWCSKQQINIGKNATLDITTSKETLIQDGGDAQINVQEKGRFSCKFFYGSYYKDSGAKLINSLIGGSITLNFSKDAVGIFRTEKDSFSGKNPTINATSPDYILFESSATNKSILSGITPKFIRKDSDSYNYPIDYLTASGQNHFVSNVVGSQNVSASNIQKGYSVIYARASRIAGLDAESKVAKDLSIIEAQVKQDTMNQLNSRKTSYKLATQKLYSGNDITQDTSQNSIDKATSANGVIDSPIVDGSNDSMYVFKNLLAQTYYLYSKIDEGRTSASGYTFASSWIEQVVQVQPLLLVTIPDQIEFNSIQSGEFGKSDNLNNYVVVNHGNVPANVDFKAITTNPGCSPDVSLVDKFGDESGKLVLNLTAENIASAKSETWGPLVEGKQMLSNPMKLDPFWEQSNQASLYVNGKHSVTMSSGPKVVNYSIKVEVLQAST